MFQRFDILSSPGDSRSRVEDLRSEMEKEGFDGYLVPHADEYRNEYLPPSAERLAWLTGFTGSAGFCIVTRTDAVLFVDGRYTLQARAQCDPQIFTFQDMVRLPPSQWLAENAQEGGRIGYDPRLLTIAEYRRYEKSVAKASAQLSHSDNLIDRIWKDRPSPPRGQIMIHEPRYAGRTVEQKLAELTKSIADSGADAALLTDPASLAWTFNIRGRDIAHTPVPLGHALLPVASAPLLFLDQEKLSEETRNILAAHAILKDPADLEQELAAFSTGAKISCDPDLVSVHFSQLIVDSGGTIVESRDPVTLPRAIKNDSEIAGARAAHLRDGVAMVRFLAWLDHSQPGTIDEIAAARQLENMRAETAQRMNSRLADISFDTISGAGPNGAIVHYRVSEASNRMLEPGMLYLVDSGGQYPDGTTDITRTIPIGEPPEGAATDFTLVLKGHIAIATARFPEGTRGKDIDALARIALWRTGRDYGHGTGHGVGSFLSVHEGPQGISRRAAEVLQPGMILSNEPGFYREGQYGIRIENLVLVHPPEEREGGNIATLSFETLTLAPIDLRLVDRGLLDAGEIAWLNQYHQHVCNQLSPMLDQPTRQWLENATRAL